MNSTGNTIVNQEVKEGTTENTKSSCKIRAFGIPMSEVEFERKKKELSKELESRTWRDLEAQGKFGKEEKLSFIDDDMLIVGCDVGSEKHYIRAIDTRGRELSKKALDFTNDIEGFEKAKAWMLEIAVKHGKKQIVLGLEPTGHYWIDLATWMVSEGISVVQVNPYAVKQTKEIEDNSQAKNDLKDPKLIANLVKDGNYGMPYLPEGIYAELRALSMFRDQLTEDQTRIMNRLHRELKIFFPEYKDAYGKIDGGFTEAILKEAPFPEDLLKIGEEGIRDIWHKKGLRGGGYRNAAKIIKYAKASVGTKEGCVAARDKVLWLVEELERTQKKLDEKETQLAEKCKEIPHAQNALEIPGIGQNILSGIIAEMGDVSRFDDVKEIQKLSGLGLVACSSGKHKGQTKISHRGRKRLRYYLYHGAMSVVAHDPHFKELHEYYTTREKNPLKKMQSLIAIAGKLLRVIYTMLKKGVHYDPEKMMKDIVRRDKSVVKAA